MESFSYNLIGTSAMKPIARTPQLSGGRALRVLIGLSTGASRRWQPCAQCRYSSGLRYAGTSIEALHRLTEITRKECTYG